MSESGQERIADNMKKIAIIAGILTGITVMVTSGFLLVKYKGYQEMLSGNAYMEGTTIALKDEVLDVGGLSAEDAFSKYIESSDDNIEAALRINGKDYPLDITECYQHKAGLEDFENLIGQESFLDFLKGEGKEYEIKDGYVYAGGAGEKAKEFFLRKEYEYTEAKDAFLDKETLSVVPETYGTELNPELAAEAVEAEVKEGKLEMSLEDEGLYLKPEVKEGEVKEKYKNLLDVLAWKAEYKDYEHTIKLSDYKGNIKVNVDGTYDIDTSFLTRAVLELSKKVDKKYDSIKFGSKKDGTITVHGGTYGQIMDNAKEIRFLKEKLEKEESVADRTPIWKCEPLQDGKNPKNYIEVDLSEQHIWHYKDGKMHCESDIVTGDKGKKRNTPTGAYYVTERIPGKYLIGTGYKTWVDRWMRLTNTGIGLHDAKWRGSFGGDIYKTNGSHGCINMPKDYAYNLYDEIYVGILVVVHE